MTDLNQFVLVSRAFDRFSEQVRGYLQTLLATSAESAEYRDAVTGVQNTLDAQGPDDDPDGQTREEFANRLHAFFGTLDQLLPEHGFTLTQIAIDLGIVDALHAPTDEEREAYQLATAIHETIRRYRAGLMSRPTAKDHIDSLRGRIQAKGLALYVEAIVASRGLFTTLNGGRS